LNDITQFDKDYLTQQEKLEMIWNHTIQNQDIEMVRTAQIKSDLLVQGVPDSLRGKNFL
jgi:hypothetical protein